MTIVLNHTIVPARDKVAAARFFADIFGLPFGAPSGHFAPVRVNDNLTLLFDDDASFGSHHYAFHVSDAEFDSIFERIRQARLAYGSAPWSLDDGKLNGSRKLVLKFNNTDLIVLRILSKVGVVGNRFLNPLNQTWALDSDAPVQLLFKSRMTRRGHGKFTHRFLSFVDRIWSVFCLDRIFLTRNGFNSSRQIYSQALEVSERAV
jgi:catechol 2,3-dioxygenase-like lactoylglutathione lyase family enzyme